MYTVYWKYGRDRIVGLFAALEFARLVAAYTRENTSVYSPQHELEAIWSKT